MKVVKGDRTRKVLLLCGMEAKQYGRSTKGELSSVQHIKCTEPVNKTNNVLGFFVWNVINLTIFSTLRWKKESMRCQRLMRGSAWNHSALLSDIIGQTEEPFIWYRSIVHDIVHDKDFISIDFLQNVKKPFKGLKLSYFVLRFSLYLLLSSKATMIWRTVAAYSKSIVSK